MLSLIHHQNITRYYTQHYIKLSVLWIQATLLLEIVSNIVILKIVFIKNEPIFSFTTQTRLSELKHILGSTFAHM